ncbi:MAG TPA: hypothetical protein VJR05_01865 [Acidimicrobiia bacterium]|nr:hypothetical protein [Acidimicrobiia bacterium]
MPPAEELGERLSRAWRRFITRTRAVAGEIDLPWAEWRATAPERLRTSWRRAVEFSGLLDDAGHRRASGRHRDAAPTRPPAGPPSGAAPTMAVAGVGVMEYTTMREPLMEVSMLESLGFYDAGNTMVVSLAPHHPAPLPLPTPRVTAPSSSRQLIPDLELEGWKPHVIARSKLGRGSFRATSVGIAGLIGFCVLVLVISLVRGPEAATTVHRQAMATSAQSMALALQDLAEALAPDDPAAIDATAPLAAIDVAARDLFLASTQLEPNDELRAEATAISRQALDLEGRVTEALSYRLVLAPFWHSPGLDQVTDAPTAAAALAPWQAQMTEVVASLPTGSVVSDHVRLVRAFVAEFSTWAKDYLDALAASDEARSQELLVKLEGDLAHLAQTEHDTISGILNGARHEAGSLSEAAQRLLAALPSP